MKAMWINRRSGIGFLSDKESVMHVTFIGDVKAENYCRAKSCINIRTESADMGKGPTEFQRKELLQHG